MKNSVLSIACNSMLGVMLLLPFQCKNEPPSLTAVTVLSDVSEPEFAAKHALYTNRFALLHFFVVDTMFPGSNGGSLRLARLNDLSESPAYTITFPAGQGALLDNPKVRREAGQKFAADLTVATDTFLQKNYTGTKESKIYQGICRELQHLVASAADRRILIIFSDLLENSALFSFYGQGPKPFLKDPIAFADSVLQEACPLPDCSQVDIYLVTFRTTENDELVNQAEKFWKAVLEHARARVHTGSSLDPGL